MMNIYMLLLMSASGTIMYLLSIIFEKNTKHHLWHYAMLVTSVIMLLVPVQKIFEIPRLFNVTVPKTLNISNINTVQSAAKLSFSSADIIAAIWIAGAISYEVDKKHLSIRFTSPYSEERREKARKYAQEHNIVANLNNRHFQR